MLPPGTLQSLKGHYDGIVAIVSASLTFGGIAVGVPEWPAVAVMIVTLVFYHVRRQAAENHLKEMAQVKVDKAVADVEMVKARHRDLLLYQQPPLPLGRDSGTTIEGKTAAKKGGKQ